MLVFLLLVFWVPLAFAGARVGNSAMHTSMCDPQNPACVDGRALVQTNIFVELTSNLRTSSNMLCNS